MKQRVAITVLGLAGVFAQPAVAADPAAVDAPAPGFTLHDAQGGTHTLADYKGKFVVLEWVNFDCPFVRKHYGSGSMQELQRTMTSQGVIWLSICSSAPGKQGYFEGEALRERIAAEQAVPTAYLVDPDGDVGKLYSAKTTPHMFVIDPKGTLIYAGGIDDKASTDKADMARATNYVTAALKEAMEGKPVAVKITRSYGCSVKYK
jgi:peroxiredoxin